MHNRKLYPTALGIVAAPVVFIGSFAAGASAPRGGSEPVQNAQLISESALLTGLEAGALFPFLDTTPRHIELAHIAVTDSTENCAAGEAPPANIEILVGQAGAELTNVMTAATNTGIGTPEQCVFHVTAQPGSDGVPGTVTDVVVVNAGGAALTGINTVTASASVSSGQ